VRGWNDMMWTDKRKSTYLKVAETMADRGGVVVMMIREWGVLLGYM